MALQSNIDAFLQINDQSGAIKSESVDDKHKELMQIYNFGFKVELQATPGVGTGLGAGKSMLREFEFEVANSTASPTLLQHCCDGTHCKDATLYIRKAGGKPQDYYIWKFTDLVITKFDLQCSDDIVERIAFAFTAIACEYKPQKADGSLGSGIKGGWDQKKNAVWTG